jgi:Zn-dependent protease
MFSVFSGLGPEVPLIIILLFLVLMHRRVNPRASLWINASPDKVFEAIDFYDGKIEDWGDTITNVSLQDHAKGIFEKTYVTTLRNGSVQRFTARFSVAKRSVGQYLEIAREGLEGKSHARELLRQFYTLTPERGGTRLAIKYHWGPRMALAQITARADLWGGVYRIKSLVERGVADDRPYYMISLAIAVLTGLLSLAAFAWILSWKAAIMITVALAVHEFGHLLAYVLIGQPWGRMIFLPFLGAMAMPRLPFETQAQVIFAALMGPGISVVLGLACAAGAGLWPAYADSLMLMGLITVALNLSNLLPVEPLDGGVAMRSIMHWLLGRFARFGLMGTGVIIATIGISLGQVILIILGMIAILANFRSRVIDSGLRELSMLQACISVFGYVAMISAYSAMIVYFVRDSALLAI